MRVAELVRSKNAEVERFVQKARKLFDRSTDRQRLYRETVALPLPPKPIIT